MSLPLISLLLLLQPLQTACEVTDINCHTYLKPSVYKDGDLVLAGFFPLYGMGEQDILTHNYLTRPAQEVSDDWYQWKNYQYVLAFLIAIEEINKNPHLLPNLSLGYDLYNAFTSNKRTLENAVVLLSGGNETLPNYNCQTQKLPVAIIAANMPTFSAQVGTLLELSKIPQVTYGPFDPFLSDKDQFPSVYQMATKDSSLAHGIICLLLNFGWTWVALYVSDDTQGEQFLQDIKAKMTEKGICVAFTEKLPAIKGVFSPRDLILVQRIRVSSANVYIIHGDEGSVQSLGTEKEFYLISGKVWIMRNLHSSEWKGISTYMKCIPYFFHGSLLFSNQKRKVSGFKQFLKTVNPSQYPEDFYFSKLWVYFFGCSLAGSLCGKLGDCPPNSSLEFLPSELTMMIISDPSSFIYHAVHVVVQVLYKILLHKVEMGSPGNADLNILPWQLHAFLRKSQLTNSIGYNIPLDEERNTIQYDIHNLVRFPNHSWLFVKVGDFIYKDSHDQGLVIKEEMINWSVSFKETPESVCSHSCVPGFQKIPQEGRPVCCFICASCPVQLFQIKQV